MLGVVLLLVVCLISGAYSNPVPTSNILKELGDQANNPLVQLIGQAFEDTENALYEKIRNRELDIFQVASFGENETVLNLVCELMKCGVWSEWSACTSPHEFSMKTKTRQCGVNTTLCTYGPDEAYNLTKSEVCSRSEYSLPKYICPPDYEIVNGRFCLKYVTDTATQERARQQCMTDVGGDLIHVDNADKQEALYQFSRDRGFTSTDIWLNGKRDAKARPWTYTYGDPNPSYENWSSGEPSNGSSELCKVYDDNKWWDRECYNSYPFVCEIVI